MFVECVQELSVSIPINKNKSTVCIVQVTRKLYCFIMLWLHLGEDGYQQKQALFVDQYIIMLRKIVRF